MKKVFIILLVIAQLLVLVSCGNDDPVTTEENELMETTTAPVVEEPEETTSEDVPGTSREDPSEEEGTSEGKESGITDGKEKTDGEEPYKAIPIETTGEPSTEPVTEITTQPVTIAATEPPHQHDYSAEKIPASCESDGYTLYACACGKSYKDNFSAALGHSYTDTVVAPTTSAQGYTEHTCSRCGDSYKDNYTDPVKITYSAAEAQQVGNNYIASLGYAVDSSLVWADVHGYYPPESITGHELGIVGGQEWLNNSAIGNVQATVDQLIATTNPNDDVTKARLYCSVTYDAATDTYTICVYYG